MTVPLPIVPPAAEDELLGSWMQRTASVYDLSAHQMLDGWQVAPMAKMRASSSLEIRVVSDNAAALIAHRMRATPQVISAMLPAAPDWFVACAVDIAVCLQCLATDDSAGVPRFRRRYWGECWQVLCSQHRTPLVDMVDWRSRDLKQLLVGGAVRRNASGKVVAVGRQSGRGPPVRIAMNAIAQMEVVIRGALAGRRPQAASWGDIGADEFLKVVRDVTTFLLTRFDPADPRPLLCVRELNRYQDGASVHCFERPRQRQTEARQGGCPSLVSLASVGEAGWRRCALFWARELMHAKTARPWLPLPLKRDRQERQRAAVSYQNEAGIEWLAERVLQWPERYRAQRWRDWMPRRRGACTALADTVNGH